MGGLRNGEGFEIKQPVGVGVLLRITSGARGFPTIQCWGWGYLRGDVKGGGFTKNNVRGEGLPKTTW
jgi:hypothetical protein